MFPLGAACWGRCDCGNRARVCTKTGQTSVPRPPLRPGDLAFKQTSERFGGGKIWPSSDPTAGRAVHTSRSFVGIVPCVNSGLSKSSLGECVPRHDLCCCILACFANSSADSDQSLVWKGTKMAEKLQAVAFNLGPNEVKRGSESNLPFFAP